jgi:hypothetical protein
MKAIVLLALATFSTLSNASDFLPTTGKYECYKNNGNYKKIAVVNLLDSSKEIYEIYNLDEVIRFDTMGAQIEYSRLYRADENTIIRQNVVSITELVNEGFNVSVFAPTVINNPYETQELSLSDKYEIRRYFSGGMTIKKTDRLSVVATWSCRNY